MVEPGGEASSKKGSGGLIVGLLVLAALFALAMVRLRPPAAKPADAPETEFSARRAGAVLAELVGNGEPHPVGSATNAATRERVLLAFQRLGYEPEVVPGFVCRLAGPCTAVQNVVARLAGSAASGKPTPKAVLLAAHYDSVPSGPGASDDLTGVAAILEIARLMKVGPAPENPVIFLIDEGEEVGLLGAEAFVRTPTAKEVGVVINLEARGTSGPGLMFETQHSNGAWIPLFARAVSRPVSSSVFVSIYERLPNDTDYSVFDREGMPGFNFALIGNAERYHTPLDNLANSSPASLQHMGESAADLARTLAGAELNRPKQGPAVFFDVLSFGIIRWPGVATLPLALLALILVTFACRKLWRAQAASFGGTILAFLAALAAIAAAAGVGLIFANAMRVAGGLQGMWPGQTGPLLLSLGAFAAVAVLGILAAVARSARAAGIWAGVWLAWAILGIVTALLVPGASYLFLLPALVAGLAGAFGGERRLTVAALLPLAVAGILWAPLALLFFAGLGTPGLTIIATVFGLISMPLAPLLANARRAGLWIGAIALVALVTGFLVPSTTRSSPEAPGRRGGITYHLDSDAGAGRWVLAGSFSPERPLPPAVAKAASFEVVHPYPWSYADTKAYAAPAPPLPLVVPTLEVLSDEPRPDGRHLSLRLVSPRGAPSVTLQVPVSADVRSARMENEEIPQTEGKIPPRGDWFTFTCLSTPPEGIELDLVIGASGPVQGYLVDRSPGLPPAARGLVAARPADMVPDGDAIVVSRKVQI
ncbi:MAG TPA: M28 family peptidase [Thermoanaerobaculia bacterium]|jgi:hypothetical protein|nr:M28 family peptidase [Thermoanaerobaculia bacterium]